jgi:2-polyprenyl-6-methoxyphenol hydroxylase-like FAD-dependent oxidoreductase
VYERAERPHPNGPGFLLLANGCAALRRLGLEPGGSLGHPIDAVRIVCCSGHVLADYPIEGAVAMSRPQLLEALLAGAPGQLVQFNHHFARFEWEGERARTVCFQNGQHQEADAFIAADGVRSSCRMAMGAGALTRPGRVKEIVGHATVPLLAAELGRRFLKVLHPSGGLAVGLVPLGDGSLIWFVQFDSHRFATPRKGELGSFLDEHLRAFPAAVHHAVAATDPAGPHLWNTVDEDPASRWSQGNVALAGDAAHPLLPFTSQGVNAALEDAVLLSGLLQGCRDPLAVPDLLKSYERKRRTTLLSCVEAGRRMAKAFVQPTDRMLQLPLMA